MLRSVLLAAAAAAAAAPGPPTRTAHLPLPEFSASVAEVGGGIVVRTKGGGEFGVSSRFSRPGPQWSELQGALGEAQGWTAMHVTATGSGRWNVSATNAVMSLERAVTVLPTHVAVSDTISVHADAPPAAGAVAIQVEHTAQFLPCTANTTVTSAELPAGLYPFMCSTEENQVPHTTQSWPLQYDHAPSLTRASVHRTSSRGTA